MNAKLTPITMPMLPSIEHHDLFFRDRRAALGRERYIDVLMDDALPSCHHRKNLQNDALYPTSIHTPVGGIFGN